MDDSLYDRLRILVVDDEKIIVEKYKTILSSFPSLDVSIYQQGEDAVKAVQASVAENRPYALAFLDLGIPSKQDELWTAEHIRKSDPFLELVIVTAYCAIPLKEIIRRVPPADKLIYLQKPIDADEVVQLILALTSKWQKDTRSRKDFEELSRSFERQSQELKNALEQSEAERAERKAAEERFADCKAIFDAFMKYQPAAAFLKDCGGRYLYANRAYKNIFGCGDADPVGKSDEDIWPSQAAENLKARDQTVLSRGKTLNIVEALPAAFPSSDTGTSEIRYYLISEFPIFRQGKPAFIGGIAVNLSERTEEIFGTERADYSPEPGPGNEQQKCSGMKDSPASLSLPGLDIGDAMKRLEGSWELYADLLSCFWEDKKEFSSNFKKLIEKKEFENALISAHALKGSAATISATWLREAAKSLEDACGTEDEPRIFKALSAVETALKKVEIALDHLPSVTKPGLGRPDPGSREQETGVLEYLPSISSGPEIAEAAARLGQPFENLFELLKKFDKCLQESDPAGAGYLQEIERFFTAARFDPQVESLFGMLSEQTYTYKFEAARETLDSMSRKIFLEK